MSVKIGNAKYGGEYKKKNNWKLKDGEQVYRILPPLGDLADSGRWSTFWNVHFGYKNSQGKLRPFQSPLVKNRQTKMIDQPDAALERIESLKAQFEAAKKAGTDATLIANLDKLVGQKGRYNIDNNHHMNVMDAQGNIGILKIRHRCKIALDAEIKRLKSEGIDPLSVENGRFLVFGRSGMGLDTTFTVRVLKKKVNVPGYGDMEQDVVHTLTPDIIARLESEAGELDKLYRRPTSEEVARLVKEGATAVDEILDAKATGAEVEEGEENSSDYENDVPVGNTPAAQATNPQVVPQANTPPAQPQAPVPATPAPAPVAAAPVQTPTPPAQSLAALPKTTAQAVSEQTDDDFLKSLGL